MKDITFYLYLYATIVVIAGAFLFTANWIRIGKASRVYKYMTFFFYATAYQHIINLYSRHLWNNEVDCYTALHHSFLWSSRMIPVVVTLSLLVGRMFYRFFFKRKKIMMGTGERTDDICDATFEEHDKL